ncbi:MAG: Hsp20/alpha crystallin family protein [SAR202 cluster bacterium]|nr:Hsp20/alpha crystallin family protein [SAR202 cluster bacterium]
MMLERWDPFAELRRMDDTLNRMWRGFGYRDHDGAPADTWAMPIDVVEESDHIVVHASMPGIKASDIDVTVENGVLFISGTSESSEEHKDGSYLVRERRYGQFQRTLRLPDSVDADKAETHHEDGVLTVRLPKAETKKAKRLTVKAGKAA